MGDVTHVASEAVAAYRDVKVYGGEGYERRPLRGGQRYQPAAEPQDGGHQGEQRPGDPDPGGGRDRDAGRPCCSVRKIAGVDDGRAV